LARRSAHGAQPAPEGEDGRGPPSTDRVSLAYERLRTLAALYLRKEPKGHTLQPTALVHEVFLHLDGRAIPPLESDRGFMALASKCMRHVLVDHARRRNSDKRGGGWARTTLDEGLLVSAAPNVDLMALDEAMVGLAAWNERIARIVELRFFCGLSNAEAATELGMTAPACEHEWRLAKAWLRRELSRGQ